MHEHHHHDRRPDDDELLRAEDLVLEYQDGDRRVRAVDHVSLAVRRGEFVGLVGPSGSGKSSLLFLLAGLRAADQGAVWLLGNPLPATPDGGAGVRRAHVGFLFQEPFLVPYLSVRENALTHATGPEAGRRVEAIAAEIGMSSMLDERPHRLSGGERQRAGVLRALANDPDVLLADEPTAALDQETGRSVIALLRERTRTSALLVVTHDPGMLAEADRVLHLRDGALLND